MWDPDGLVVPRSQEVVNFAIESAKKRITKNIYNTPAVDLKLKMEKLLELKLIKE